MPEAKSTHAGTENFSTASRRATPRECAPQVSRDDPTVAERRCGGTRARDARRGASPYDRCAAAALQAMRRVGRGGAPLLRNAGLFCLPAPAQASAGGAISIFAAGQTGGDKVTTLKCLSLRQPWAWAVVDGGKNIENRTWNTRVRGPILIHAAKGMTGAEYDVAMLFCKERGLELPNPKLLARGGIVGAARLIGGLPPERNTLSPFYWHM